MRHSQTVPGDLVDAILKSAYESQFQAQADCIARDLSRSKTDIVNALELLRKDGYVYVSSIRNYPLTREGIFLAIQRGLVTKDNEELIVRADRLLDAESRAPDGDGSDLRHIGQELSNDTRLKEVFDAMKINRRGHR